MSLIELKEVSKYYHTQDVITMGIRKVSLAFSKGEFVAVTGESGSGKSTLMNVISGVDTYEEGELIYNGIETSGFTPSEWDQYRKDNIAFIFQDYNLIDSYTVLQNVELALIERFPDRKKRRARATELIREVELESHIKHKCTKLSGGQKQRVAIARALAKDAPVIVADEPTGNLDETTAKSIISLLDKLSKDKLLLMVTHNFDDVQDVATRKVRLFDGSVVEDKVLHEKREAVENSQVIITPEKATATKGEKFKREVKKGWIKFSNLAGIARTNIFAAPKKSIFIFSTIFVASVLIFYYVLAAANVILIPDGKNYYNKRRDTAVVYYSDRSDMDADELAAVKAVPGVESAMLHYSAIGSMFDSTHTVYETDNNSFFYISSMSILNVASYSKKYVEYGELPDDDNEILIGLRVDQQPYLDLIGTEVELQMSEYFNDYTTISATYIISGYTYEEYTCYLTEGAIETLSESKDLAYSQVPINYSLYDIMGTIDMDYVIPVYGLDGALFIFDEEADYDDSEPFYDVYGYLTSENLEDYYFYVDQNGGSYGAQVQISTQTQNSEYYEALYAGTEYEGHIILAVSQYMYDDVMISDYSENSNSICVIFDSDRDIDATINRLEDAAFRVVYEYGAELDYINYIDIFSMIISMVFFGVILMVLGVIIIAEIMTKVMRTKKKDYNVMRTLGLTDGSVKAITYLEIIFNSLAAFFSVIVISALLYIFALIFRNFKLLGISDYILPNGFFHYTTFNIMLIALGVLLLTLTLIISRFNKKLHKSSVKKSAMEQ